MSDVYKTIFKPTESVLFKDKNSKFFGYAFPVNDENEVKHHLEHLKKEHHSARHWCYAYQIGTTEINYRANDDGEPNNSAGMPIYGQIQSFQLTNILIVVVRYFGGVKLGVSGLINAYKTTAQLAIENAKIIEKTINAQFEVHFNYTQMNQVMRIIKENQLTILEQNFKQDCKLKIEVRLREFEKVLAIFKMHHTLTIIQIND